MLGHVGATLAPSWRQVGQKERTTTSQDRPKTLQDHPKMSRHHAKTTQVAQRPPKACFWKGLGKVFSGMLMKTGSAAPAVRPLNIMFQKVFIKFQERGFQKQRTLHAPTPPKSETREGGEQRAPPESSSSFSFRVVLLDRGTSFLG